MNEKRRKCCLKVLFGIFFHHLCVSYLFADSNVAKSHCFDVNVNTPAVEDVGVMSDDDVTPKREIWEYIKEKVQNRKTSCENECDVTRDDTEAPYSVDITKRLS